MNIKRIHVMAAVIRDSKNRILIAKRPDHAHLGGLWEFPGGKLEATEERFDGLCRELYEELGIKVLTARPLLDIRHDYPDKSVRLDVWLVTEFSGTAHGAEGQPVCWVLPEQLNEYPFPAANTPIVSAAQLPERYLITPEQLTSAELLTGLERACAAGIKLVQLRLPQLSAADYTQQVKLVTQEFGERLQLLIKGGEAPPPGLGWHLTSQQLRHWAADAKTRPADLTLLAASCHNAEELLLAQQIGADFVTLSPVQPTQSHAQATPLGWDAACALIESVNIPVYLLGGLGPDALPRAFSAGAQGIAGIRQLWH